MQELLHNHFLSHLTARIDPGLNRLEIDLKTEIEEEIGLFKQKTLKHMIKGLLGSCLIPGFYLYTHKKQYVCRHRARQEESGPE